MSNDRQSVTATILFTDLVNSTDLLQRVGDERAQRMFETHHRLLRDAVSAHGGDEVKWTGDGLMVAFTSTSSAVRCAIAMQQAARMPADGERLHIRAGLNVGEALRHDASDFFGTMVVIASRLCAKADAGQVLCSAAVRSLLPAGDEFDLRDSGELELKGIASPVHVYDVLYRHDPLSMLTHTPFVGREAESAALRRKLDDVRAGNGAVAMLVGEPGIGKTRMIEEFSAHAGSRGARILAGRCYDGEWAPPFSPFVEALRSYAREAAIEELQALPAIDLAVLARIVPAFRERLPALEEPPALQAEGERYRLLDAVAETLTGIAAIRPLVLVLDDLHWADNGTIALLRHVTRNTAQKPLMILGAYRDVELDRQHPLAAALADLRRETSFERIALKGLTPESVGSLLAVIAEQEVPQPLVDAIGAETNGNPFFIKEVLLHLVEERKIFQEDGRWTATLSVAEMGIPEGVKEVIGRRLSRLSAAANHMLTTASAMTAGFTWAELQAICDEPDRALLDAFEEALGAQVLFEPTRGTYDFAHALIRHTLYEELSTPRRLMLHRRIGEALERLYAADLEPHLAELAHHFAEAGGEPSKALDYSERAGEAAWRSIAYETALVNYERAVLLMRNSDSRDERHLAKLLIRVANSRLACGFASADAYIEAAEAARDCGAFDIMVQASLRDLTLEDDGRSSTDLWPLYDPRLERLLNEALVGLPVDALALRACVLARLGDIDIGSAFRASAPTASDATSAADDQPSLLDEAERLARASGNRHAIAYVLFWSEFAHSRDPRGAEQELADANDMLALAASLEDRSLARAGHMWRAYALMRLGDPGMDHDLATFHEMSYELALPQPLWWSSVCVAMRTLMQGNYPEAERQIMSAFSTGQNILLERSDSNDGTGALAQQLYQLRFDQGRIAELEPLIRTQVEQNPEILAWRVALALAYTSMDRQDDARREYELVMEPGIESWRSTPFYGLTLPVAAEVCAVLNDEANAADLYERLLAYEGTVLDLGWRTSIGSADRYLGLLANTLGRFDVAQRHFEVAIATNARMNARPWLARTQHEYAVMLLRRDEPGDREHAQELLEAARATAQEIRMDRVLAQVNALLVQDPEPV